MLTRWPGHCYGLPYTSSKRASSSGREDHPDGLGEELLLEEKSRLFNVPPSQVYLSALKNHW
jgi:hypothetical protein